MKKQLVSLAVLSACSAPVFAQSSVTLYGLIDEGLDYTNNQQTTPGNSSHVFEMESGIEQGSRWGLKGSEDLGGGLKAVFKLENGFNLNSGALGQGGRMFGRQAWVGLSQSQYGTVTFGRQYDSVVDFLAPTTANGSWGGYMLSHPYDNDNTDNSFRVDNTVKFTSPSFSGLQFGGTYSFSNDTNFANNRQYSVGGQYANGGLVIAGAYLQANNPGASSSGAIASDDANFASTVLRIFGAGVNYTFGPATAGFVYTNSYMKDPTSTVYLPGALAASGNTLNSLRFQNFEVNGKYQITPAIFVGAQYVYTYTNYDASAGTEHPKYQTFGLVADYSVSKRTDFYFQMAYQHVSSGGTGTQLDDAMVPSADEPSSTANQLSLRFAIRHKF
jgi:predicted porin